MAIKVSTSEKWRELAKACEIVASIKGNGFSIHERDVKVLIEVIEERKKELSDSLGDDGFSLKGDGKEDNLTI